MNADAGQLIVDAFVRSDIERSAARVADVELGLSHPIDGPYWRDKAQQRVQFLDEDSLVYGLLPHEETERQKLNELLARYATQPRASGGGDR